MNETHSLTDLEPSAIVADFERRSRRFETPCGDGVLVWNVWGSGPAVLLLHGGHGSWSHWIRNIDVLARDRTVLVPDIPGYGDSAMPPRQDHAAIASVLAAGLRHLVASEIPIDMIGFSFGGIVAAFLAAFYPELARRLILVDSGGGLDTPLGNIDLRRVRGLEGAERRAAQRANLLGLMLHAPESVDELALHLQATNEARARLDARPLVIHGNLLEALRQVSVQIDAIWGEHDRPHPPADQEVVLRGFDPDLDFRVIPAAGHWAMYERPVEFNNVVLDLLARPLRTRSVVQQCSQT
jgi:pimeloyl-ACP methyl ester carboxylesterase